MRRAIFYTYSFIFLFSLVCIVWLIPAYCPPFSGFGMPPSALPYTLCAVMMIFSLPIIIRSALGRKSLFDKKKAEEKHPENPIPAAKWIHLILFTVVLSPTMLLMHYIGFIPAGIIILSILQVLCGNLNPLRIGLTSVITVCLAWACMTYVLAVPMP